MLLTPRFHAGMHRGMHAGMNDKKTGPPKRTGFAKPNLKSIERAWLSPRSLVQMTATVSMASALTRPCQMAFENARPEDTLDVCCEIFDVDTQQVFRS